MAEFVFIRGKVSWVKPVTPNKFGDWSFQMHPDQQSLELIRDMQAEGLKNQLKKDDDGYYISFKRPQSLRQRNGKIVPLVPPQILNSEGNPMDGTLVGNGSDAIAKLEVYTHPTPSGGRAKAARWHSMRIDNLVEFNRDKDFPEPEKEMVAGLAEQPKMVQDEIF